MMKLSIEFLNRLHLKMLSSVFHGTFLILVRVAWGEGRRFATPWTVPLVILTQENLIFRSRIPRDIDKNIFPEKKTGTLSFVLKYPRFWGLRGRGAPSGVPLDRYVLLQIHQYSYAIVVLLFSFSIHASPSSK